MGWNNEHKYKHTTRFRTRSFTLEPPIEFVDADIIQENLRLTDAIKEIIGKESYNKWLDSGTVPEFASEVEYNHIFAGKLEKVKEEITHINSGLDTE